MVRSGFSFAQLIDAPLGPGRPLWDQKMHAGEITPEHEALFEAIDELRDKIDDAEHRGQFEAASALLDSLRVLLRHLDGLPDRCAAPSVATSRFQVAES